MNTSDMKNSLPHSNSFHERQLALFDAYITDELDVDEKRQVEQDLQTCLECEHIFKNLMRFRHKLGTPSKPASSNTVTLASSSSQTQSIVPAVLAHLEQYEPRKDSPVINYGGSVQAHSPRISKYSPVSLAHRHTVSVFLGLGIALCCVLALGGLVFFLQHVATTNDQTHSRPAPLIWQIPQKSLLIHSSASIFALKEVEVTSSEEFRFYYAFQSSSLDTFHASAISSLNTDQKHPQISLSTTVVPLGTIDGISVGLIRVHYLERVGQTIILNITSPQHAGIHWQLTPLKQLGAEPHPGGGTFHGLTVDQRLFPNVVWYGYFGPDKDASAHIAYFTNPARTHYIYLQADYFTGKVVVITKEQCIKLVGKVACP